jgi:AcrR family transcriptional regulator
VVADKGYAATTVADIVEGASVSRSTFYEQFPDKEACFLAAFNFGVEYVLGHMAEAQEALADPDDWRARVRSDLETFFRVLASEPAFARALHLEVLAAGPAALQRRSEILGLFTERTRRMHELARQQESSLPELPQQAFEVHTGGMDELVREQIRTRGVESVPSLLEPAVKATLSLFGDRP